MKYKELWKVYSKVFDLQTIKNLEYLEKAGHLYELIAPVSEGKESIVFKAKSAIGWIAAKIYKVMNISYRRQYEYLISDPRFHKFPRTKIGIIYTWVKKEFSNLTRLYKSRINVPMPIAFKGNVLLMEWIGTEHPAPQLKDILPKKDEKLFDKILEEYRRFVMDAELVHGDLSEFNILIYRNIPYIIDVSQAVPVSKESIHWLRRDLRNLVTIGKKLGKNIDIKDLFKEFHIVNGNPEGPYS